MKRPDFYEGLHPQLDCDLINKRKIEYMTKLETVIDSAREAAAEVDRAGGDAPHEPCMGLATWIRLRAKVEKTDRLAEVDKCSDKLQEVAKQRDGLQESLDVAATTIAELAQKNVRQDHAFAHEVEQGTGWRNHRDHLEAALQRILDLPRAARTGKLCGRIAKDALNKGDEE